MNTIRDWRRSQEASSGILIEALIEECNRQVKGMINGEMFRTGAAVPRDLVLDWAAEQELFIRADVDKALTQMRKDWQTRDYYGVK